MYPKRSLLIRPKQNNPSQNNPPLSISYQYLSHLLVRFTIFIYILFNKKNENT